MATYSELRLLKEEERVLMNVASKLSDQLNRLKVEELSLQSMIREAKNPAKSLSQETTNKLLDISKGQTMTVSRINEHPLDLDIVPQVKASLTEEEEEEEEEMDSENDESFEHNQLTAFMRDPNSFASS